MLRRPPGPTVLVTAAHCTFLCKSDNIVVVKMWPKQNALMTETNVETIHELWR